MAAAQRCLPQRVQRLCARLAAFAANLSDCGPTLGAVTRDPESCRSERRRAILRRRRKSGESDVARHREEASRVEACLDPRTCRACRYARHGRDRGPRPARHLDRREQIDRHGGRQSASCHRARRPRSRAFSSIAFTLTVDKQDGRRFSGKFTSARTSDTVIAVVSRSGSIYMVDDDGYTVGTMLAPNRMELCYMHLSPAARVASCTELTKRP